MKRLTAAACAAVAAALAVPATALADGTETLGPPSVVVQSGTGVLAAGVGTQGSSVTGPKALSFTVPAGATVKQALLYWEGHATGFHFDPCAGGPQLDGMISVNGNGVAGTLIGGPTNFFLAEYFAGYRADITPLVSSGANSLTISDMFFRSCFDGYASSDGNDGVGIVVIYDDGTDSSVAGIRDGHDLAYKFFAPPLNTTVPQTFTFTSAAASRPATLATLAGSISGIDLGGLRGNVLTGTFNTGQTFAIVDGWQSTSGAEFDAATFPITIPAGASSLTVQALSDGGTAPASFTWIAASLAVQNPPRSGAGEGCTPGYWKNHDGSKRQTNQWPATGYATSQRLDTVFSSAALGTLGSTSLRAALDWGGGDTLADKKRLLLHHAVAALLNAAHPDVDYGMTTAQIIADVNAALLSNNATTIETLKNRLDTLNNAGCPIGN